LTSGNPILDKNLKCIEKYNPDLSEKLLNLTCLTHQIELVETELKEPNLLYNGLPLHNPTGAEAEAKAIFEQSEKSQLSINVIFGMGLGYLFKEFTENSKGPVIVFEPNLEILRVTLELVDFSKELSREKVYVVSDFLEFKKIFQLVFQYKSEVYILHLNSYTNLYKDEINSIITQVEMLKGIFVEDANMLKQKGADFVLSVLNNLPNSFESIPLKEFENIYKGKTALIVSAGPTLDSNIENIKKNMDKFVIFCVGTAFKALMKNGIVPDFVNIIEVLDCSGQLNDFDLSDINLIVSPYTHKSIQELNVKQKFIYPSAATRGAQYWSHLTGIDISEYMSKGTVAYAALASAKMLGFKKIVLVGQDLAFINNSCYSKDSAYADLIFEINPETGKPEYKAQNYEKFLKSIVPKGTDINEPWCKEFADNKIAQLNKGTYFVKGISGEMLPTAVAYALFAELFNDFAKDNPDLDLINTSMVGAQLDGFKNVSFDKAMENVPSVKRLVLSKDFKYDKKLILKHLIEDETVLAEALEKFAIAKDYCSKFEREVTRRNVITKNAEKYYGSLLNIYNDVTIEYYEKNQLYKNIAAAESMELVHYAGATSDKGDVRIKALSSLLKEYFYEVEVKVLDVISAIKRQRKFINESINSES